MFRVVAASALDNDTPVVKDVDDDVTARTVAAVTTIIITFSPSPSPSALKLNHPANDAMQDPTAADPAPVFVRMPRQRRDDGAPFPERLEHSQHFVVVPQQAKRV